MAWNGQDEMTANVLDRIVVLLLAMADLAERAAGAPAQKCRLVLGILRRGEAVAHDAFCVSGTGAAGSCGSAGKAGDAVQDAMALAASLRILALIVGCVAAVQRRLERRLTGGGRDGIDHRSSGHRRGFMPNRAVPSFSRAWRLDTS